MNGLQKLIVSFFALTVILSVASLVMFFIEVPYKSTTKCVETNQSTTADGNISIGSMYKNGKMQECTFIPPKEPSVFFNCLINATIACGVIFLLISIYAYMTRPKEQIPSNQPKTK